MNEEQDIEIPLTFFSTEVMKSINDMRKQIARLQEQVGKAFIEIEKIKEASR